MYGRKGCDVRRTREEGPSVVLCTFIPRGTSYRSIILILNCKKFKNHAFILPEDDRITWGGFKHKKRGPNCFLFLSPSQILGRSGTTSWRHNSH